MRTYTRISILTLLILSVLVGVFIVAGCSTSPAQTMEADLEWFSSLGFPDVRGLTFVRAASGGLSYSVGDEAPRKIYLRGFLLSDQSEEFTVLTTDLLHRTLRKSKPGTPQLRQIGYAPISLEQYAEDVLQVWNHRREDGIPPGIVRGGFEGELSGRSPVFALAWCCWRQGLTAQARVLYEQARDLYPVSNVSFRSVIEQDLGHAMMVRALIACGNSSVTRSELLAKFQAIVTNYPHFDQHAEANEAANLLASMIAEDDEHARSASLDPNELPMEERIGEWIFRLRDQNGHQLSDPGGCDVFYDPDGSANSPAHHLLRIGYPAVPQLIASLSDRRFTRSTVHRRDSYTVLRVGDCALEILRHISGRRLGTSLLTSEKRIAEARQGAEAWWTEFQMKGEKQTLIDGTASGTYNAPEQGEMLTNRYPDAALSALIQGAKASTAGWPRSRLIRLISSFEDPLASEFLMLELHESPFMLSRVEAARCLHDRGMEKAVTTIIRVWNETGNPVIIDFLANCDSAAAIAALGQNLPSRPVDVKFDVIGEVRQAAGSYPSTASRLSELSPRTLDAIEQLLVEMLSDTEDHIGMQWNGVLGPRICDAAGYSLSQLWPGKYVYDLKASLKVRDRQCIECRNVWRRQQGLSPLDLPQAPTAHVTRAEANKVTAIEWARDSAKPDAAMEARIDALKDKPLDADTFVDVLTSFAANPVYGAGGLDLRAIRNEDLTGVVIRARLMAGEPNADALQCFVVERVMRARQYLLSRCSTTSLSMRSKPMNWEVCPRPSGKLAPPRPSCLS